MQIVVSDGSVSFVSSERSKREFKGKSLVEVLQDYVVIDIETTGLDSRFDEIIELSAARVRDSVVSEVFVSLVKPERPLSEFIIELTGITNEMLDDAPSITQVLPQFLDFVGDDVLVGHNVNFDVNFLYDETSYYGLGPLKNNFVDTLRLARRLFPELPNHKLGTIAEFLKIEQTVTHRAAADCDVTNAIYQHIVQHVSDFDIDLTVLFKSRSNCKAADIHAESNDFDEDSPFFGKVCVFTGVLERMVRRDAIQIVANMGGICGDSVTAKTNYLILGNNDYCSSIKDGKSSKHKKAEELILKGKDISIISEDVFYDMIGTI